MEYAHNNTAGKEGPTRTIWLKDDDPRIVQIIDQRRLPHQFIIEDLTCIDDAAIAIKEMHVRGAGLIGAAAGYGMYLAALENPDYDFLLAAGETLKATRPTAVNLEWAVERQLAVLKDVDKKRVCEIAFKTANAIADEDADCCERIGKHGVCLIEAIYGRKQEAVNILTHCNAGWLAFVEHGSATAPIYEAHQRGIGVHVWVDETRPRNQGARLTAWELGHRGVPHTVIADNVGGHLMQNGLVDICLVGTDRTTRTGDVANKIGTYLKALAAFDNQVPFYAALPSSSFDWNMVNGSQIPIEQRDGEEVKYMQGMTDKGIQKVLLTPETSPVANYGFDVTPSRLITGLITERGICRANEASILGLFPEHQRSDG